MGAKETKMKITQKEKTILAYVKKEGALPLKVALHSQIPLKDVNQTLESLRRKGLVRLSNGTGNYMREKIKTS